MRLVVIAVLLWGSAAAQNLQLVLPDSTSVLLGESYDFAVRLTGEHSDAILLPPPPLDAADWVIGEPNRTSATPDTPTAPGIPMRTEWPISLRPHRAGTLTVPSLSVLAGGQILRSAITPITVRRDTDAEGFATVTQRVEPSTVYVGQRFRHHTTVTLLRSFVEGHAIPLFRQRTDFPVKLEMRWPPGVRATGRPHPVGIRQTFVLDQSIVAAHSVSDGDWNGKATVSFTVEHDLVMEKDGDLTLASPLLRFAYATRFEEDLFRNRVPKDRKLGSVLGGREVVRVLPLPATPPGRATSGAVGSFRITTESVPVAAGTAAALRIRGTIRGEGSWMNPVPPAFGRTDGLHLVGVTGDTSAPEGTYAFFYDFLVLRDLPETLPPLSFTHFDPSVGHFVTTESASLSLLSGERVVGTPSISSEGDQPPAGGAARRPLWDGTQVTVRRPSAMSLLIAVGIVGACILAAFPVAKRRLKRADFRRTDPLGYRAHFALDTYLRSRRAAGKDEGRHFAEYIAAKLKKPDPSAVDPHLMQHLLHAGVPEDLARRACSAIEQWLDTRFDRIPRPTDQETQWPLVVAIEDALKAPEA